MGSAVFCGRQNHFLSLSMYQINWVINVITAANSIYADKREHHCLLHMRGKKQREADPLITQGHDQTVLTECLTHKPTMAELYIVPYILYYILSF